MLMFHGVPGAGKKTLLSQMEQLCRDERLPHARVNLREAATPGEALARVATTLKQRHRLELRQFQRVLVALAAHAGVSHPETGTVGPVVDLLLDGLGLIPLVGPFTFVLKLGKSALQDALERGMESSPFRAAVMRLGGQNELLELLERSEDELRRILIATFVADVDRAARSRKRRVVLFFENHDALCGEAESAPSTQDDWLRQLAQQTGERGHLMVIAGCDRLTWSQSLLPADGPGWLIEHPVEGLTREAAIEFLRKCGIDEPPGVAGGVTEGVLRLTNEAPDGRPTRHHCFRLTLCAEVLVRAARGAGGLPDVSVLHAPETAHSSTDSLIRCFQATLPRAMGVWLEELSLAPQFDAEFALELDAVRHHGNRRAGWRHLRRLALLEERERGFLEMHPLLREALRERVATADARVIHAWAYEYWTERARQDWQEHGYYSVEHPRWQDLVRLSVYHLCRSGDVLDEGRASLLIVRLLLDVYWWWGESLPLQFWNQLIQLVEVTLNQEPVGNPTGAGPWGRFRRILGLLREFEAAWPKGWIKDRAGWDERVRGRWGDDVVERWDWEICIQRLESLRSELALDGRFRQIAGGGVEGIPVLEGHVTALLASYLGRACSYRAAECRRAADPEAAHAFRTRAEQAFLVLERWFSHREEDALHTAWSRILLGELFLFTNQDADALASTTTALTRLGAGKRSVGAAMEGAAEAHRVRARVYLERGDCENCGSALGRALAFHSTDRDEYTGAYLRDLTHFAERLIQSRCAGAPDDARRIEAAIRAECPECATSPAPKTEGGVPSHEVPSVLAMLPAEPSPADFDAALAWFGLRYEEFLAHGEPA